MTNLADLFDWVRQDRKRYYGRGKKGLKNFQRSPAHKFTSRPRGPKGPTLIEEAFRRAGI